MAAMVRLGFRFSFCLQHRVFSIPGVKKTSVSRTLCLEQRDYSSSGPVRYVPNKSLKINENVTSEPVNGYEKDRYVNKLDLSVSESEAKGSVREVKQSNFLDLKKQNRAGKYRKISSDDFRQESEEGNCSIRFRGNELTKQFGEVCDEAREHTEEDNSEQSTGSKQARKITQDAENMAIRYLGSRAYSAMELKKKLIEKRFPPEIVDGVINDFQYRGLINDGLYAELFSRSRWSSSTWGPRRIKQALFKKGVSNADADAAIKLVFEDREDNRGGDQEAKHGLSEEAMDQLYIQASKQWLRGQNAPTETRKARLVRWLQYRGFHWGVIGVILKRLQSHDHL